MEERCGAKTMGWTQGWRCDGGKTKDVGGEEKREEGGSQRLDGMQAGDRGAKIGGNGSFRARPADGEVPPPRPKASLEKDGEGMAKRNRS